jgi:hypothetical protein
LLRFAAWFAVYGLCVAMKFRLLYEGEIAPRQKAKVEDIHHIRMKFDPQLAALWQFPPLSIEAPELLKFKEKTDPRSIDFAETRGDFPFIPIVSKKIDLQCALDITFLRQQAPGQLISDGGDVDNRVKTLLDALSVPPLYQQHWFKKVKIEPNQAIHCLLQDDSLVTQLSVETDGLLPCVSEGFAC